MNTKNISVIFLSLLIFLFYLSCDDMEDIHEEYLELGRKVYLGKVDSVETFPGINKIKLTWYISSDPRIENTIIYWNMRSDSIIKPFNRTIAGVQKDSIVIENLPETIYDFDLKNVNSKGESSLFSYAIGTSWGERFIKSLKKRSPDILAYDFTTSTYTMELSPTFEEDNIVYSQIKYTDRKGQQKLIKIDRDSSLLKMHDFPAGGEFQLRTVFSIPNAVDSVFTDYIKFFAPEEIISIGKKVLSLAEIQGSSFLSRGETLIQRNQDGDLIMYETNEVGQLAQTDRHNAIAPWSQFRDFFYLEPDRFIGITPANSVEMYQLVNNKLNTVKLKMGTGFIFPSFIPFKGMFYSLNAGEVKRWLAQPNGTWGAPNGITIAEGFEIYKTIFTYKYKSILGVDNQGYLWYFPVMSDGSLGTKMIIGKGWNKYKQIIPFGDKLLCLDANNEFWLHNFSLDDFWVLND